MIQEAGKPPPQLATALNTYANVLSFRWRSDLPRICTYSSWTPSAFKYELPLRAMWKLCSVSSRPDLFNRSYMSNAPCDWPVMFTSQCSWPKSAVCSWSRPSRSCYTVPCSCSCNMAAWQTGTTNNVQPAFAMHGDQCLLAIFAQLVTARLHDPIILHREALDTYTHVRRHLEAAGVA